VTILLNPRRIPRLVGARDIAAFLKEDLISGFCGRDVKDAKKACKINPLSNF